MMGGGDNERKGSSLEGCDVLVIGAGLGGLTCATELARQGLKVCVFEQHRVAGGYAQAFRRKGYHFDVSLHYTGGLDPGSMAHGILMSLGVFDKLRIVRSRNLFTAEFPGLFVDMPNDRASILEKLVELFPHEERGIKSLFEFMPRLKHDVIGPHIVTDFDIHDRDTLSAHYAESIFAEVLKEHVTDPKLLAVLGQMWMYVGLPPDRSSANFTTCVFAAGWLEGAYHIVGGGGALVRSMVEKLREFGGECLQRTPVVRIILEDGVASGVELENGRVVKAPTVISGVSPTQTFFDLLSEDAVSKIFRYRLEKMEPSLSMYATYLGLDCAPSRVGIPMGNFFYNHGFDWNESYRRIMDNEVEHKDWCITSNEGLDDAMCPTGGGIVSAVELTPAADWLDLDDDAYLERKKLVAEKLLNKYEQRFPGLKDHVVVHEMGTPRTIARFSKNHRGAVCGLAQTLDQSNSKRLVNRTPIPGLFLTGAWTWSGGGYEGAMMSGVQTASAVMAETRSPYKVSKITLVEETPKESSSDVEVVRASAVDRVLSEEVERDYYRYRLRVRVYGDDLNSRGHADASSYLRYMDRGRVEAIEKICADAGDESWLTTYVMNVYRIEARLATIVGLAGELEIRTGLRRVTTHRASFDQRIVNVKTGDLVVDANVEVLFLDRGMNLIPAPAEVLACRHEIPGLSEERSETVPFGVEEQFPFRTPFRVYFEDTDTQQITYHVSYARFCERALFEMVRAVWADLSASAWMAKNRSNVSRMDLRYLNSSKLGDKLEVCTGILNITEEKITMGQRIIFAGTTKVVVDATTDVEFRDENERIVPVPKQILDLSRANLTSTNGGKPKRSP